LSGEENTGAGARAGVMEEAARAGEAMPGPPLSAEYTAKVMLRALAIGLVATCLIGMWLDWDETPYLSLLSLAAVGGSFRLLRRRRIEGAILLSFVPVLLFVSYCAFHVRGIYNPGTAILPVLLIVAGRWLRRPLLIAFTALTLAAVLGVSLGRWATGRAPLDPNAAGDLALVLFMFCVAAVCAHLVSRHVEAGFEQIRRSEARYRRIFDNIQDAYFEIRGDGSLLELSPTGEALLGVTPEQWPGRRLADWCADASACAALLRSILELGRVANSELALRGRSGEVRTVLVSARLLRREDEGGGWIAGSMRDITERRNLEEKLSQSRKLDSIGKLAGGIAHDFNNLLTVINGHAGLALRRMAAGRDPRSDVEAIRSAGDRAADLTRRLLAFSRRDSYTPRVAGVAPMLERLSPVLHSLAGEDIRLEIAVGPGTPRILADPGQFDQVLINLLANARDAIHDAASPSRSKRIRIAAGPAGSAPPGLPPGRYLELAVSDTGAGIRPEIRDKIFEPFFSTRTAGAGLGLATVYGIVRQNGGTIQAESTPGCGAAFRIHWPATDRPLEPEAPPQPRPAGGAESILLVEDDEMVRRFTSSALTGQGFAVVEAANGLEALEKLTERDGGFSMVVTDVVMPGMDGRQLANHVRDRFQDVKLLFVSGYAEDRLSPGGVVGPGVHFLRKPYTAEELAGKVRAVLDGAS
jgi:PAS domain S-box-containing protein